MSWKGQKNIFQSWSSKRYGTKYCNLDIYIYIYLSEHSSKPNFKILILPQPFSLSHLNRPWCYTSSTSGFISLSLFLSPIFCRFLDFSNAKVSFFFFLPSFDNLVSLFSLKKPQSYK